MFFFNSTLYTALRANIDCWQSRNYEPSFPFMIAIFYATEHMLETYQKIEDGFTDAGRGCLPPRSVEAWRADVFDAANPPTREVIVVDMTGFGPLIAKGKEALACLTNEREAIKLIANECNNRLGGRRSMYDITLTEADLTARRVFSGTNCVPLHKLESGVCRHRAILFKILCQECAPSALPLACRLVRGGYDAGGHAWNVVRVSGAWYLCDVMHDPGTLYADNSEKASHYKRLDFQSIASDRGGGGGGGVGGNSVPLPAGLAAQESDPNFIACASLEVKGILGEGGFGVVKKAVLNGFRDVAVKYIKTAQMPANRLEDAQKDFKKELELLKECRDPNIIQVLGWNCVESDFFFVMEFMENKSLCHCIQNRPTDFAWDALGKEMAIHAVTGLCYLHTKKPAPVVHFDLKTLNILVSANNVAKLADVGLAVKLRGTVTAPGGYTPGYTAPEILMALGVLRSAEKGTGGNENRLEKADIFSFGAVLVTICTQQEPCIQQRLEPPADASSQLRGLINGCISQSAEYRPTAIKVLEELKKLA